MRVQCRVTDIAGVVRIGRGRPFVKEEQGGKQKMMRRDVGAIGRTKRDGKGRRSRRWPQQEGSKLAAH